MIDVVQYNYKGPAINTTSRESGWSKGLSPFLIGPCNLYDGYISQNMENAWQYSKVYKNHIDENGNPTPEYFWWAHAGWNKKWADRYPAGKGARPVYSYWSGMKLDYIEARKKIYIPLYSQAVKNTAAFMQLKSIYEETGHVVLRDFDGYDYRNMGMTLQDVVNNNKRKMGHAFVLAMMLMGITVN